MSCLNENTVIAFVEGLLEPEAARRLEAHAASCPACRRLLSELAKGISRVDPELFGDTPSADHEAFGDGGEAQEELTRGALVGRYIVLGTLGSGGMGVVYAAYDPELDRKVALKLLRPELTGRSQDLRSRMMREAQALARLSHPNVVAVHDAGTFRESVFLAMELIDGVTLGAWLSQRARPWREVVETFAKAGRGLAAAHAAGFVHRDFKPANVLVSEDGRVRVVDFGLVRAGSSEKESDPGALAAEGESVNRRAGAALTQTGAVLGTPAYMAPEQFERETVDARADQWSFCAALFEALYGQRPFTANTRETVLEEAPKGKLVLPPRAPHAPAFLLRALERGLRLSPEDRFSSMEALLAALTMDPERAWRKRALVAAGAFVLGLGVFGATRLRPPPAPLCQGAPAKLAEAWSEEKKQALRDRFAATGLAFAEDTWVEASRALDAYGRGWVAMHTEACEATRVRGEQSDEVLSLRMLCLDRRLAELRAMTDVLSSADAKGVTKAVEATAGLTGLSICADVEALRTPVRAPEGKEEAAAAREIEEALAQARARSQLGQYPEALAIASKAATRAGTLGHLPTEAEAQEMLGSVRLSAVDPKAAEQSLRTAFAAAVAGRHDRIAARAAIELVFVVGSQLFRFEDAGEWAYHAEAALRRAGGDPELDAQLQANRGSLLYNKGDFAGARREYELSLATREKVYGPEHRQVVQSLDLVAMTATVQGDFAESARLTRRSVELSSKLFGTRHPAYGESLNRMGRGLLQQGRYAEALPVLEEALVVIEAARGPDHPHVGTVLIPLGDVKRKLRRYAESLLAFKRARVIFEAVDSARPFVADCAAGMGDTHKEMGKLEEALAFQREALAIREEVFGAEHEQVGASLLSIGQVLLERGQAKEALGRFTRALELWEKANGPDFIDNADALVGMGEALLLLHEGKKAIVHLERAETLLEKRAGNRELLARAQNALARAR
ncbi:tetratricopeptide repeat protein [Polyangium jinanense]|uniref:Tetratricopeptide repeat protein n=1 Tax=Polyangium jinanense TaxID=2829994 RepID=A0A9X3XE30_9BACT|nr:tetratricopeptide repeat protein [Polyangium jinanense]MDC3958979.1 tetratricopeptide repeat protein [Polyangium jinanense]MDC3986396.1 tetratricopeptide repeat protein [Polyangium jinanense]